MYSSNSGTYNSAVTALNNGVQDQPDSTIGSVSKVSIKSMFYTGSTTLAFAHMTPWFKVCHANLTTYPDPNGSGGYTPCNSHQETGYDYTQNGSTLVDAQLRDIHSRGFDGVSIDWYGSSQTTIDGATAMIASNLNGRCSGVMAGCFLYFAVMEDKGAISHHCAASPSTTTTSCVISAIDGDIDYIRDNYFDSPGTQNHSQAYLRLSTSLVPASSGKPVVLFFLSTGDFQDTSSGPSSTFWSDIWSAVSSHVQGYSNGNAPLLIYQSACGFTLNPTTCPSSGKETPWNSTGGAFTWLSFSATNGTQTSAQMDSYNPSNLDLFYQEAICPYGVSGAAFTPCVSSPVSTWAAGYKGADHTNEGFNQNKLVMRQHCGVVWHDTLLEPNKAAKDGNPYFSSSRQLPIMQVGTWNDYDEGTEIETGIDSCYTVTTPSQSSGNLAWSLAINTDEPSASTWADDTKTIDHYTVFDSDANDSQHKLYVVADNVQAKEVAMSALNLACGARDIYVQMVGKSSIRNSMSSAYALTTSCTSSFSPNSYAFPSVAVGQQSGTVAFTLQNTGDAYLSISSTTISDPNFVITQNTCGATLAASASCEVYVKFAPQSSGSKSATLTVSDNDSYNANAATVTMSGTGTTSGGSSTFSPTSAAYGSIAVGSQSAPKTFTFTNNSGSSLAVTMSATSGFTITSSSGCGSVANGGTCTVSVAFQPASASTYNGLLTAGDGGGNTLATAGLSGTGTSSGSQPGVLYSNVQNTSGWTYCADGTANCGGGNGGATLTLQQNLTNPLDQGQNTAAFGFSESTPYSNGKFQVQLGAQDTVTQLQYDMDVQFTDPTAPTAVEFTLKQVNGGTSYPFQFQCDFGNTGMWNVYNPGASWVSTNVACQRSQFPVNQWVHLSFKMNTSNGRLNYTSISVGGVTSPLTGQSFAPATQASTDQITPEITFDGDSLDKPFTMYVGAMTIYNAASGSSSATLTPSTLDLGNTANGGTSATRALTLKNNGTAALSISSVALNSSQFTQTNTCGASLAAGASCTISVAFKPTTYGQVAAVLTVSANQTVTANVTGVSLNSANVLFSQVQNNSGWTICTSTSCVGGNGTATGTFTPNQSSPEINAVPSGKFSIGGTPGYSSVRFEDDLAAQDSVTAFEEDADVYMTDPTVPQNIQFALKQVVSGTTYPFQLMCNLNNGGIWQVWDPGASGNHWTSTSLPCAPGNFAANDWTHVAFTVKRMAGQIEYLTITVGATTYTLNQTFSSGSAASTELVGVEFFEEGDSNQDPYSIYLDNLIVSKQ